MRCETCKLITRPDIAKIKGEKWCECDEELNQIYRGFQNLLKKNDEHIETLAKRLNEKKD